jgi:hypothetical protein
MRNRSLLPTPRPLHAWRRTRPRTADSSVSLAAWSKQDFASSYLKSWTNINPSIEAASALCATVCTERSARRTAGTTSWADWRSSCCCAARGVGS